MGFSRPIMWNVPHWAEILFYLMIPVVLIGVAAGVVWRVRKWRLGRAEPGTETVLQRLKNILDLKRLVEWVKTALFQSRLGVDRFALVMHLAIFWGMAVLLAGTALATVDQDFTNLPFDFQILRGGFYKLFELVLDVFGVVLIAGVGLAAYRRYVMRPPRLVPPEVRVSRWDAFPFLATLALIAVTGFVAEGLRLAEGFQWEARLQSAALQSVDDKVQFLRDLGVAERFHVGEARREAELRRIATDGRVFPAAPWAPVGYALAAVFTPLSSGVIRVLHQLTWWAHALVAFGFMLSIPFTKAFHLISSPINLLFRQAVPAGRLPVVAESGVATLKDLTWRQLMQIDSCTWCGRCKEVCPGCEPLSPRNLVLALGSRLVRTPAKANGQTPSLHANGHADGGRLTPEELWSCATCRACEDVCPVYIQQPRLIVDLRRHLVDQGKVEEGLQDALMKFQRYGNSFGQSARKRAEWTKPLEFKLKDGRKEQVEYLWFVGDYASYDQRAQEVTRAVARVFHRAGLDVGLLFEKEQNSGNDVRRVGEEGLFGMLREKNAKELESAKFQAIVTTDPHTYNTLKNEYDELGHSGNGHSGNGHGGNGHGGNGHSGNGASALPGPAKKVLHYTELLDRLIREGKLSVANRLPYTATYHDPCYLGRYNGVYEAPRRVLAALGVKLVEMPRNRANGSCCGAGGGRIWMKDRPGEVRPAEGRVREALALEGVQCLVVACPKDLVMFQDAVKTVGAEGRLRVVDLGELVLEATGAPAGAPVHAGDTP